MKTYPIIIKATNYEIQITEPPDGFVFPSKAEREQWTAALRSGNYQKGIKCLSPKPGSYCCLGVLQFLRDKRTPIPEEHQNAHDLWGGMEYTLNYQYPWERGEMPHRTRVKPTNNMPYGFLTTLNDSGMSFADIADIIDIVFNPDTY